MKSDWTFKLNDDGDLEAHDGERVRALIIYRRFAARRWVVHRIRVLLGGEREIQGGERFRTLADAKDFCCNRPGIWGR